VEDLKDRIDELADLMEEYKLSEAELVSDGFRIAFKKRTKVVAKPAVEAGGETHEAVAEYDDAPYEAAPAVEAKPSGMPVTSPMTGIYYSAPSPGSPPFVSEGDAVTAGQPIGLIEAMKVFNEIPAPTSGTVHKLVVESGQLVNLGDVLLYIG